MFHAKMYLAGAAIAAASMVATGPAFATATTLLLDDGPLGTSLITSVDGSVTNTQGPDADHQGITNTFSVFVGGPFSIPTTNISILEPGTSPASDKVSDDLQFFGLGSNIFLIFGSNDLAPLPLPLSNPINENGLVQTLFSTQDAQGDTLNVQFLSEGDAPKTDSEPLASVPEPSTLAMFGAALGALGMMMRRRSAASRA